MANEKIVEEVTNCLVDALGVDSDEISMDSSLTSDLGAESIDFLDIVFRLEKAFGIKIPRGDLFPDNLINNPEFVNDGRFSPKGLQVLQQRLPHLDRSNFKDDPQVAGLADMFTVGMLVDYVKTKVA